MTNKFIASAFLCGALTVLFSASCYAQTSQGPTEVTIIRDNSSISAFLKKIEINLAKIVEINKKIGTSMDQIYGFLVGETPEKDVNTAAKYYFRAKGLSNNPQYSGSVQNTTKSLTNLIGYGVYAPSVDPSKASNGTSASYNAENAFGNYSTTSVDSLLTGNQYKINSANVPLLLKGDPQLASKITDNQSKAALGFIQNAALANQSMPTIKSTDDESSDVKEYLDLRKTMLSIQSVANNTLANTFVSRLPYQYDSSGKSASKLGIINNMNTEDSSNGDYWDANKKGIGSRGLLPRTLDFITRFFSMNYNLNNISKQLNRTNLQLAMLITQNTLLIQHNIGKQLYTKAQASQPTIKFKSEEEKK